MIPADAEKRVVDLIHDRLIPSVSALAGFTVGTRVAPGKTPTNFIRVRNIGGTSESYAERWRVDVMVWTDGSIGSEAQRNRTASILLACLRKYLRCTVFATPIPLPDPADNTKTMSLFTVELLLKGNQA